MANKQLEQERNELNTLINKGVSFEVKDTIFVRQSGFFGAFRKKVAKEITRKFTIREMTLATLDRLSREWIEFAIDEDALKDEKNAMTHAIHMTHEHAIRCARIVAIAVLGERHLTAMPGKGGVVVWEENTRKIDEYTQLFARTVKPTMLYQLVVMVNTMSNLGDFLNAIRLMSQERTTVPTNRVANN